MDTGFLNVRWSKILIDQLIQQGMDYFCVAPGSRSTPLAIAIAEHPAAQRIVHFDERGLCFHALGFAKGARKAAVVLTTSGTATVNLFPALMEAHHERVPMIVLTADRPPELRDCGATQTCDQVKLFGEYVRWQCDLPCPTSEIGDRFLATTVAQGVYHAHASPAGPVHLNCMFRKPLFSQEFIETPSVTPTRIEQESRGGERGNRAKYVELLSQYREGLILVGSLPYPQDVAPIIALSRKLQWPLLPDILSQVRTWGKTPEIIAHYETLLRVCDDLHPRAILHLGDRIVSKTLKYWLAARPLETYIQVSDHPWRQDPHHQVTHRLSEDPALFCRGVEERMPEQEETEWATAWQKRSVQSEEALHTLFHAHKELTEPGIIRTLHEKLTPDWALFLANSMPVRDADLFFFPKQPIGPIFGNRGVAGIDGNIATAVGIAQGCRKPTIAVLGDLATLHDVNSLPQLHKCPYPVLIIVINNQGGGVFSFLPIAEKKALFEEFVAAAHPYTFENAAQLFHIPYFSLSDLASWETFFSNHLRYPQSALVEIQTERARNYTFHQEITQRVKTCLQQVTSALPH